MSPYDTGAGAVRTLATEALDQGQSGATRPSRPVKTNASDT